MPSIGNFVCNLWSCHLQELMFYESISKSGPDYIRTFVPVLVSVTIRMEVPARFALNPPEVLKSEQKARRNYCIFLPDHLSLRNRKSQSDPTVFLFGQQYLFLTSYPHLNTGISHKNPNFWFLLKNIRRSGNLHLLSWMAEYWCRGHSWPFGGQHLNPLLCSAIVPSSQGLMGGRQVSFPSFKL